MVRLGDAFLDDGIASQSYDKPGVGESEGDWTTQTFDDRADEAVAAAQFLSATSAKRRLRSACWG